MSRVPRIRFKGFKEDWEQRKLGEIGIIITGSTPSTSFKYYYTDDSDEGIVWVTPTDIINNITVNSEKKLTSLGQKVAHIVPPNTILITCIASIGKNTMLIDKGSFNQQINGLIPYENKYEPYFLLTESFIWSNKMKSSAPVGTMQIVNRKEFSEIDADIPNKSEQNSVGSFFRTLDHLITLHQRKLEKLKIIKKSMLENLFPQNGEKTPKIRFSGFTEDWEQRKLLSITTMHARIGWQNLRTTEFLDDGKYLLITGTDFVDGKIDFTRCYYVKQERYNQDRNIQIKNGCLLITKDGTLGKVAYVNGLNKPATLNAGIFNVEIRDENKVDRLYLYQYIKAPFLLEYVNQMATGGTIKHLNQNILVDFMVSMPQIVEQKKIGELFQTLDHLITLHQSKLEKLQKIKKSMLESMFA